jgi:hypothetical protein
MNIWTIMVFAPGQAQGIVLQYKGRDNAVRDHELIDTGRKRVRLVDDFGRVLTMTPTDDTIALLQDVDAAAEGNTIANVKNGLAQQLAQVRGQEEGEKNAEIRNYNTRARFAQSGGAIRS